MLLAAHHATHGLLVHVVLAGHSLRTAIVAGLSLGQVGEFGFLLAALGTGHWRGTDLGPHRVITTLRGIPDAAAEDEVNRVFGPDLAPAYRGPRALITSKHRARSLGSEICEHASTDLRAIPKQ